MRATLLAVAALATFGTVGGCNKEAPAASSSTTDPAPSVSSLPGHDTLGVDTTPKEGPRLVPQEAYIRTYLALFGGLSPLDAQAAAQGHKLFDAWTDYLVSLGVPDYGRDIPRGGRPNAIMLATFERIGIALCDKAVEHDLAGNPPPVSARVVFAFDLPASAPDQAAFTQRFDVLHRTFLGYPVALAPDTRAKRFFGLYQGTVATHSASGAPKSAFNPEQAGWATVCYGLIRHPEFHLY